MDEMQSLIAVDSIPQITEQLDRLIEPVRERVSVLMRMECTEDNKQECKQQRASVRKTKDELREALRSVKAQIMEPFIAVEEKASVIYNELEKADLSLKGKVAEIEDVQKQKKEDAVKSYFLELRDSMNIGDWLKFEDMQLKITLTSSERSLMNATEGFLEKVSEDMNMISRLPDSVEVMAEFRSSLNLTSAVKTVEARKAQIERARLDAERREKALAAEKERTDAVQEAAKQYSAVSAPTVDKTPENATEKRYKASFTVIGTKDEILAVKRFLEERGITYES